MAATVEPPVTPPAVAESAASAGSKAPEEEEGPTDVIAAGGSSDAVSLVAGLLYAFVAPEAEAVDHAFALGPSALVCSAVRATASLPSSHASLALPCRPTAGDRNDMLRAVMAENPERCIRPLISRLRSGTEPQQLRAIGMLRGLAHSTDRPGTHDYQPLLVGRSGRPNVASLVNEIQG